MRVEKKKAVRNGELDESLSESDVPPNKIWERNEENSSIATDSERDEPKPLPKLTLKVSARLQPIIVDPVEESGEDMDISDGETALEVSKHTRPEEEVPKFPAASPSTSKAVKPRLPGSPFEEKQVDEGVEIDMEEDEQPKVTVKVDEAADPDDSDYTDGDQDGSEDSDDTGIDDEELEEDNAHPHSLTDEHLRLMPRSVLERILQRLLKPPQSPQTRRVVQAMVQESVPETVVAYDTSVRIKVNEKYTTMVEEMQEQHNSLTSDDFADAMARFLRTDVRVLQSFPGSTKATFELILYIAEHSYGDLELDNRRGFGERTQFDAAADRTLLYVAEQRLRVEGDAFRTVIPGYLATIRSQAMYLYRHGFHPKNWFPASTTFLQASLEHHPAKTSKLRSQTR